MKKILSVILSSLFVVSMMFGFVSCSDEPYEANYKVTFDYQYDDKPIEVKEVAPGEKIVLPEIPDRGESFKAEGWLYNGKIYEPKQEVTVNSDMMFSIEWLSVWDGERATTAWYNPESKEFVLGSASDLAGLAALINGTEATRSTGDIEPVDFSGKTIKLTVDIDLQGKTWTPIANGNRDEDEATAKFFKGTFDGQGHTISNLTNNGYEETLVNEEDGTYAYGFIAKASNATIRNLNFENVDIDVSKGDSVAAVVGYAYKNVTIENCTVSGTISGADAVAGVLGRAYGSGKDDSEAVYSVKECTNDSSITSDGKAAGIVGIIGNISGDKLSTISDCTNNGTITCNGGGYSGGIIGQARYTNITSCTNNGKLFDNSPNGVDCFGGIAGLFSLGGEINDCHNNADITIQNGGISRYGIGGIVGWINYEKLYESSEILNCSVKNSSNKGNINTPQNNGVGGIVGMVYWSAIIDDCSNSGDVINTNGNMTGGIIGGHQATDGYNAERENKLSVTNCTQNPDSKVESTGINTHSVIGHIENPCKVAVDFTGTTPNDEDCGFYGVKGLGQE